ncbi:MAG: AAC(3) family N-acetyltransferase, partial [Magnetococcales bacterium]|nr:AAC(3) family N-acetyltransferase [Magnetococcales bacterium]
MDAVRRAAPAIDPMALIALMRRLLGPEGTLLMPTFPFRGREEEFIRTDPLFNPRRTPSRVGLLTELFRRLPEARRSLHPTHPVAGIGPRADFLLGEHHRGRTYGPTSPFYRLRDCGGRVVGLGTQTESFTIQYVPEELHPRCRNLVFHPDPVPMPVLDGDQRLTCLVYPKKALVDYANVYRAQEILRIEGLM